MIQDFSVLGMTCEGCVAKVGDHLKLLEGAEVLGVDLKRKKAIISANRILTLQEIQEKLPKKYTVTNSVVPSTDMGNGLGTTSKWKQLYPLFLVFAYLLGAMLMMNYREWNLGEAMLDFMGLFYIVFSFFKILDIKGFAQSFQMYDPLAKRLPVYGRIYPFLELVLGLFFLVRFQISLALWATLLILGITTFGVARTLLDKKNIQCACLGTTMKLPMTEATFIENAIMLVMALYMLFP